MGRWTRQDATVCIFGTVNCAFGENTSDARHIVDAHNADCDAYEALIADLEAELDNANAIATWVDGLQSELARVKAESLRVVKVKNENEISFGAFVRHIFLDGKFVRLEQWETEE